MTSIFSGENLPTTLLALGLAAIAYVIGGYAGKYTGAWYENLVRPALLPPWLERLIPFVWAFVFACAGIALALIWAARAPSVWKASLEILFTANLALNYWYSHRFTIRRDIKGAFWIAVALVGTVVALMVIAATRTPLAALALAPYLLWGTFATYLTHLLDRQNPPA